MAQVRPVDPGPELVLRPLARGDFPLLSRWLQEPLVARWWCDPHRIEALEEHYGPSIDGVDPTHVLIASAGGQDVGLVQWYRLADEPSYAADLAALLVVPPGAGSLDYLLGSAEARGRGLATAMVRAALGQMRAAGLTCAVVAVHELNQRSWRLLERCGFERVGTLELDPDNPADSRDHVLHRLDLDPA